MLSSCRLFTDLRKSLLLDDWRRHRQSPDAFFRHIQGQTTIEDNYLDGVSITHGASGSRTHIWSLGAGHSAALSHRNISRCPCDNSDRYLAPLPPAEVGDN